MTSTAAPLKAEIARAIVTGSHGDPFSVLGMHAQDDGIVVRAFAPGAVEVELHHAATGRRVGSLERIDGAGLFAVKLAGRKRRFPYRFRIDGRDVEDPYRFGPQLSNKEIRLIAGGEDIHAYRRLGAHAATVEDVPGVRFAVWAPHARRVSVVGPFNDWDGKRHPMRLHPGRGIWEIFLPGLGEGALYKFEIMAASGEILPQKADPYGLHAETRPETASIVADTGRPRPVPFAPRASLNARDAPIAIYEVHLGSWKRGEGGGWLGYRDLARDLVPYVAEMGFTHVELLPVSEHPFDGSWGYQPIGLFAPTSRFGAPADFRYLIDSFHEAGIGVLADWVPGHFPDDAHGLVWFDGTPLYEHPDPRRGRHVDWGTLIYDYGRPEVAAFLVSNAVYWLDEFGLDGLRVDAVASMLYLDYSRDPGQWVPNERGGNENLEAVAFLKRLNEVVFGLGLGATTMAEESTAWPMVSRPTSSGGLGFGYKWNMGWMNDTLAYMREEPQHRRRHHDKLTFGITYAFAENFVLPLSHDEVVHGKGSLIGKMPGGRAQKFANLRLYLGYMYTHPGKKLLFMGGEFGQEREWNHDAALDWRLLDDPRHAGIHRLVRDLNALYRRVPALHVLDCEPEGFEWIDCDDADNSVLIYLRKGRTDDAPCLVAANFGADRREGYRIGVPCAGRYAPCLNTDDAIYAGGGSGPRGPLTAEPVPWQGRDWSIVATLPPLGLVAFLPETARPIGG